MRIGRVGYRFRAFGVAVAALAAVLLAGHPAAAEAGRSAVNTLGVDGTVGTQTVMADRSCTVTNGSSCKITTPIWFNSNSSVHIQTLGITRDSGWTYVDAFHTDNAAGFTFWETNGVDHNTWDNTWVVGNYVFELTCYGVGGCQGATLYVDRF